MNDLFSLKGKNVVLFGGKGYLGGYFSQALLNYGATVHNIDVMPPQENIKEKLQQLLEQYPDQLYLHQCDATQKQDVDRVKQDIVKQSAHVDVLINAITAKGNDFYKPFEQVSLEGWDIALNGNLTATFLACQSFIPEMVKQGSGSVINIASIYGIVGNDQRIYKGSNLHKVYVKEDKSAEELDQIYSHPVYPAAKGGVIALTKYLAAYYGKDNIRVNTLTPGGVSYPEENDAFVKKYSERTPLGRKADPDEMNGALLFLASDASSYVSGHNLVVDGGWTCW